MIGINRYSKLFFTGYLNNINTNKVNELPDCIKLVNGELEVDGVPAKELIREYGTPLFAISEKQIKQNYKGLYQATSSGWIALNRKSIRDR